jgi:hypothetical protein
MTEREWQESNNFEALVRRAESLGVSLRRRRLFAVACCFAAWDFVSNEARRKVEATLRAADGLETPEDRPMVAMCGAPEHWPEWVLGRVESSRAEKDRVRAALLALVREVFGNPFRPVLFEAGWRSDTAVSLSRGMYESGDFSAMPILGDALQDAGCDDPEVLEHCRDPEGVHVRGCWVVDLVLGKE